MLMAVLICMPLTSYGEKDDEIELTDDTQLAEDEEQLTTDEESVIGEEEGLQIEEEEEDVEITFPDYQPWERVMLQGKLKMQGLPLSPTLKIFMQRDSVINISVRAPFIGEAGRLIMTLDSIMAINKMNKTYVSEQVGNFGGGIIDKGRLIGNIQDLLLARFFLPGHDVMNEELDELVEIYYEEDQFNVVPKGAADIEGVKYGYVIDDHFNPLMIVILPEQRPNIEIDVIYNYELKGYNIRMEVQDGESVKEITLEMKEPEWGAEEPKEIDIVKKYKKVGIGEFMKGIKG